MKLSPCEKTKYEPTQLLSLEKMRKKLTPHSTVNLLILHCPTNNIHVIYESYVNSTVEFLSVEILQYCAYSVWRSREIYNEYYTRTNKSERRKLKTVVMTVFKRLYNASAINRR